ncbi:MAG: hypothetical protein R2911_31455 [Caldilineaceae bacterium]
MKWTAFIPPIPYSTPMRLIPQITPHSFAQVASGLGGNHGVDVTGGMAAKVAQALRMIENQPGLEVS